MPLPATRTVVETYTNPVTGQPATGRIVLTPYPLVWTDTDGDQILAGGGTITITAGAVSQPLVTTDADDVEPSTGRLWRYEERLDGLPYRERYFTLPIGDGTPIAINRLIEADPGLVGYIPVEGPPGPQGPAGPTGATGPEGPQPPLGAAGAGAAIALRSTDPTTTNARTPTAHADSHASGGTDPLAPAAIGAETPAGAQTKADAAQSAAVAALAVHEADSTSVHGIADTAALETQAGATSKVATHTAASDPHGDRTWANGQFYPLSSGNALDGYVNDALNRVADLETRMTNAENEMRSAVKTADESVTSSITLQDDDHLFLSVVAGGWYAVEAYLDVEADPAGDLLIGWSGPASAVLSWTEGGISAGNTNNIGSIKLQRNDLATSSGVGIIAAGSAVRPAGVLRVAGTAGTFRLRWAQSASLGTATIIKAGSWLKLTRIA